MSETDDAWAALQTEIASFNGVRVRVMVDLFRNTVIASKAPIAEILWAQVSLLVALIRTEPEKLADGLDMVQRMIGLNLELSARKDASDAKIH